MAETLNVMSPQPPRRTLPSFVIGRDPDGHWIALETHGLAGGLFKSQEAAHRYAVFESDHRAGAIQWTTEPLRLRL